MTVAIPKIMSHIWIGPRPAPQVWMDSWRIKHPSWQYRVYDNDFLTHYPFRTQKLINEYFARGEYAGVQDLMRYEILYDFGGVLADADAVCLNPVDELFKNKGAYAVYDRADMEGRGLSPYLASDPGNPLIGETIKRLLTVEPWELRKPMHSTGNRFLMQLVSETGLDKITIFPHYYFVPWHHSFPDIRYTGPEKVYADQKWGTATFQYNTASTNAADALVARNELAERRAAIQRRLFVKAQPDNAMVVPAQEDPETLKRKAKHYSQLWNEVQSDPDWQAGILELNTALLAEHLRSGGGTFGTDGIFYRSKLNDFQVDAPFRTSTALLRGDIISHLVDAGSVLQIGLNTGHMLHTQASVSRDAPIHVVHLRDDVSPRATDLARVAMTTLSALHGDRITFAAGRPGMVLAAHLSLYPAQYFTHLHFNGVDEKYLRNYGAAIERLLPDGLIILQDVDAKKIAAAVSHLQIIGEVGQPLHFAEYGAMGGGIAVLRRRPAADRAASFSATAAVRGF